MTLYMRDQENIEKGIEQGIERGCANQLKKDISRMIMTKRFTNDEIADILEVSLETVISVEKELTITES